MLTCVIHYAVLSPVCYLYAAMNNDQRKRVYFDSGIWEPDEPEKKQWRYRINFVSYDAGHVETKQNKWLYLNPIMTEEDLDCLKPEVTYTDVCEDDEARVFHQKGNC